MRCCDVCCVLALLTTSTKLSKTSDASNCCRSIAVCKHLTNMEKSGHNLPKEDKILHPGSLLHSKIARFYKTQENSVKSKAVLDCINKNYTYKWENVHRVLHGNEEQHSEDLSFPRTYDDFLRYFQRLEPLIHLSHKAFALANLEWQKKLQWLHVENQMQITLQEHHCPTSEVSALENVLFLTSVLENGFGNIFYTITGKHPPHLLRDLLDTRELKEFLGETAILFLKILMGSPESVNLRNIVWHGFPLPSEIHPCYASTLLIAAVSISDAIEEQQVQVKSRPRLTDFSRHLRKILKTSIDLHLLADTDQITASIETSKWTCHSKHKLFWHRILDHYQNGNYWRCVILLLPQIELVLRRMFGEGNSFDITAKLEEYYITMTSIFESEDNALLSGDLCAGVLHLMYDVFISPFGMRIRDKVSHGEVDLDCIDKDICSILLYIGLNLISSGSNYTLDEYRSQFHLNSLAVECIETSRRCVLELISLKVPSDLGMEFNWNKESMRSLEMVTVQRPADIFNRHKKEPELFTVLMRISQLIAQVCENYKNAFDERFRMHINRELRSRARKTLGRMVEAMPGVAICLENIVNHLAELSNHLLREDSSWLDHHFAVIQRFCKQTLKIVENMVRYSDRSSNEWLNVLECCSNFGEVSKKVSVGIS